MATRITHKRSSTQNKTPLDTDLVPGELAINTTDGKLFLKDDSESVVDLTKQIFQRDTNITVDDNGVDASIGATVDGDQKLEIDAGGIKFNGPVTLNDAETLFFNDADNNEYIGVSAPDDVDFSYIFKLPPTLPIDDKILTIGADGQANWRRNDIFGGNRIYVSDAYGDDSNDGVNLPVKTLKRACQLAASLGQTPAVDPGEEYYNAKRLLEDNRTFIAREAVGYINATYPTLDYDQAKCERDVGLILDAVTFDIILGGNSRSVEAGESYDGVTEVQNNQKTETIDGIAYARDLAVDVINNRLPTQNYQTFVDQITYPQLSADVAETDVIDRFNTVIDIIDTGTSPAVIEAEFRTIPITVSMSAGDYYIDNPIIVPDQVSVVGDGIRAVVIRPLNANKDMFRVRNGAYMFGITFRDGLNENRVPSYTFDWAISFDDPSDTSTDRTGYFGISNEKSTITLSPYIQNCSIISFLGANGVWVDGAKVVTPNIPNNVIEAENPADLTDGVPEQGKSMVANAFTMISFGGIGWLVSNEGYAQIVSCFQIFCLNGSYTQSGGYLSITNSATNFGLYALRSSGFSPNSFSFDRGIVADTGTSGGVTTLTVIGTERTPIDQFIIRIRNADSNVDITSDFKEPTAEITFDAETAVDPITDIFTIVDHGFATGDSVVYTDEGNDNILGLLNNSVYYVGVNDTDTFRLFNDEGLAFPVNIIETSTGNHKLTTNVEELTVENILDTHQEYQRLTLEAGSYSFTAGQEIIGTTAGFENTAFVLSYDSGTNELVVSNEFSIIEGNPQRIFFDNSSEITAVGGTPSNINVNAVSDVSGFFTTQFRVVSTKDSNVFQNPTNSLGQGIRFHRPSIINSSAHTWEYAGAGTDYNALPQNGGVGRGTEFEQYSELPGRVYSSGTNELGDFKVGDFIIAENKSGNITFRTQVSVGELTILRLSLSDIEVNEFSTDTGLGDNEPGGASNSRISTQRAIRTFIANRLGAIIDKDVSTAAVPGAVVQLNAQGQINQDLLPPARGVTTYNVDKFGGRLDLATQIPPIDVISGDNASESYDQIQLELTGPVSIPAGEVISQDSTGASGTVKTAVDNDTIVQLIRPFEDGFNTIDELRLEDSTSLGANSIPIDAGEITPIVDNYFLKTDTASQFLVLSPGQSYNFTGVTLITGANSGATGEITNGPIIGVAFRLDSATLEGGSGYSPSSGTQLYTDVPLTGGSGSGAVATILISNGSVDSVGLTAGGSGYVAGDTLSANAGDLGGTGSGFSIDILRADTRLFIDLVGNFIKFAATSTSPEYIEDSTAEVKNIAGLDNFTDFDFLAEDISLGGDVDYAQNTISFTSHGFTDGESVQYFNGGNLVIGNLLNQNSYFVRVVDSDTIELYNNYAFTSGSKVLFGDASSGIHILRRGTIDINTSALRLPSHGFTAGEVVRFSAGNPPSGVENNGYYYIGSITTNTFTFHTNKSDAQASVNGVSASPITYGDTGSGSATLTVQNVEIIDTTNTSSIDSENWGKIAQATFDASNIVSGVLSPSRLAAEGTASTTTFLRGDSDWAFAVQNIRPATNSALSVVGDFFTDTVDKFYNELVLDVLDADEGNANPNFTSKGIASFAKSQFEVPAGEVTIRDGVVDAGALNGKSDTFFTNPLNLVGAVPVAKGGTGLTTSSKGDLLISGSNNSLTQLNIGATNSVLVSDGEVPSWSNSLTLGGTLTVSGTVRLNDATPATNNSTGALAVSGGVGVGGDLYASGIQDTPVGNTTASTGTFTNLDTSGNVTINGADSTVTVSPTGTGTVTIAPAGGVTVGSTDVATTLVGNTTAIGSVILTPQGTKTFSINPNTSGTIDNVNIGSSSAGTGSFTDITTSGTIDVTNSTAATSTTSGALTVSGGVGIQGELYAGSLQNTSIGSNTASTAVFTTVTTTGEVDIQSNTASSATTNGALHVAGGVGIEGTLNVGGVITDTIVTQNGVELSQGTNIDQLTTKDVNLTLSTNWQDTGITQNELVTGSYYVQIYANDNSVGGGHVDTYYSGIMSWFSGSTNESTYDEILLNRTGSSVGNGILFVRLLRTSGSPDNLKLQLAGNTINTGEATYTFKFRRLI